MSTAHASFEPDSLWLRLTGGENIEAIVDLWAADIEERAVASGIDMTELLYHARQKLN